MPAHNAYDVYAYRRNGTRFLMDTVFASYRDEDEMYRSLVNHDGYPDNIEVVLRPLPRSHKGGYPQ